MTTLPQPPLEARLITRLREAPPRMSMRAAAIRASEIAATMGLPGISPARWAQLEKGARREHGQDYPETGPAQAIAKMAAAVGATPGQLSEAGRADAAGELGAILEALAGTTAFTGRQKRALTARVLRDTDRT